MAANYWESKWARSITSHERLLDSQLDDRARGLTEDQIQQLKIHFTTSICLFVRRYKEKYRVDLRRRIASTATVYFHRFYLRNCFCHVDPRLTFVGCIYLAAKVEESVLHAKHLVMFARSFRPPWSYDVKHVLDVEMLIMEDLSFNLVLFSPYRSLSVLLKDLGLGAELGPRAWAFLNDSYHTDIHLLHAPHTIALAAILLAAEEAAVLPSTHPHPARVDASARPASALAPAATSVWGTVAGTMAGRAGSGSHADMEVDPPQVPSGAAIAPTAKPTPGAGPQLAARVEEWLPSLDTDLGSVADAVIAMTGMLERYAAPISVEAANRLLDTVQGGAPTAGATQRSSARMG